MIKFVICGIEHSGTTLVSDLLRQIPTVDAGFEGGVLLCQSPRDFPNTVPFSTNILRGWGISKEDLDFCCDTNLFADFYDRLQTKSRLLKPETVDIFDKTPRYLTNLSTCLERVHVPFLVTFKDPRAIVYSDFSRSRHQNFDVWFSTYVTSKLKYMGQLYSQFEKIQAANKVVLSMSLEQLCMNPRASCETIFHHCGYEFQLEYLLLKNLRFAHTRTNSISARIPFEYLEHLTLDQQRVICTNFSRFDKWFYF